MTKSDNPFLKALKDDIAARNAEVPKGYRRARPSECGVHFKAEDSHIAARIIALKPTNTPEGHAAWEREARANHDRIEKEGDAILVLSMRGLRQGFPDFEEAMQAWREGNLELPTLAEALGMQPVNNAAGHVPRAQAARRETNEQLEARLARQREERRTGIRLERPGVIRVER